MNRMLALIAGVAILGALAIGCSGDDDTDTAEDTGTGGNSLGLIAPSGPLTIAEATSDDAPEGPLLVRGYLIEVDGEIRLCDSLAESSPPQCGGDSLLVENLDFSQYERTQTEGDVTWFDEPVEILGTVDGDSIDTANDILQ
jgi:hypothetical protein